MSRDYANKKPQKRGAQAKKNPPKRQAKDSSRLKFFLLGVVTTIAVQIVYYVAKNTPELEDNIEQVKEKVVVKEKPKKPTKPDITFYQTLPDAQVQVDVKPVPAAQNKPYTAVLQAGSFKSIDDAEQRRAEVLLLGLDVEIESRENDSGVLWHRLIVGPFESRAVLNKARSTLENNRIDTLLLQR